jgi:CubicO group peptidase (beta-lactamase class C family)
MKWYCSQQELLEALPNVELAYHPNSGKYYSNLGVALLGIALERVAGLPYPGYIHEKILHPLDMTASSFNPVQPPDELSAIGYVYPSPDDPPLKAPRWDLGSAMCTGGLRATAWDLGRFLSFHLRDSPDSRHKILSLTGVQQMRPLASRGDAYLGWGKGNICGCRTIAHSGGHLGFIANSTGIPELNLGVVVLINSWNPLVGDDPAGSIAAELLKIWIPEFEELRKAIEAKPQTIDLSSYIGTYSLPGEVAQIEISLYDGQLLCAINGVAEAQFSLVPISSDQFGLDPNGPTMFTFSINENGEKYLHFAEFSFRRCA